MCRGDDPNCAGFAEHRRRFMADLAPERRAFLKSGFAATGGAAALMAGGITLTGPAAAQAATKLKQTAHYHLPATAETVHWGYFSRSLKAQVEIESGDYVTIETLTHHANDDAERMVTGDPGRRERVPVDQGPEGRRPARGRPGGCQVRPRRGARRPHLHRPGGDPGRRARRRAGGAHPRRGAPALRQSDLPGERPSAAMRRPIGATITRT